MSDAEKITQKLIEAGATRSEVIEVIDGYGSSNEWDGYTLIDIIAEAWNSDTNSGDEFDGWIINGILERYNLPPVTE